MKVGILISDLSIDQARTLLNDLGGVAAPGMSKLAIIEDAGEDENESGVAASGDFDSSGLPYDERIHAGSKTQNKDGTWKKRKGVQQITVDQVEAELRARQPVPAAPVAVAPVAPVAPAMPAATVVEPVPAAPLPPVAPVAPAMPAAPLPPVAAPTPAPAPAAPVAPVAPARDFQGLMSHISNLYRTQQLTDPNYSDTIVSRINAGFNTAIATITDIAANPQMVDYAWQCLKVDGKDA